MGKTKLFKKVFGEVFLRCLPLRSSHFGSTLFINAIEVSNKKDNVKTKFYNFDELLIEGQYKKPQLLYTDAKQKVKFERLLKLKKDLLPKLKNTQSDPTLR